jgi:hypothetical protein
MDPVYILDMLNIPNEVKLAFDYGVYTCKFSKTTKTLNKPVFTQIRPYDFLTACKIF